MSHRFTTTAIAVVIAVASQLTVFTLPARAMLTTEQAIANALESTIVDLDIAALAAHVGPDSQTELTYQSLVDPSGWAGTLTGVYQGFTIQADYTGTITPVGGESNQFDITWASTWLVDDQTGSGFGAVTYTETPAPPAQNGSGPQAGIVFSFSGGELDVGLSLSQQFEYDNLTGELGGTLSFLDGDVTLFAGLEADLSLDLDQLGELDVDVGVQYEYNLDESIGTFNSFLELGGFLGFSLNRGQTQPDSGGGGGGGGGDTTTTTMTITSIPVPSAFAAGLALLSGFALNRPRHRHHTRP